MKKTIPTIKYDIWYAPETWDGATKIDSVVAEDERIGCTIPRSSGSEILFANSVRPTNRESLSVHGEEVEICLGDVVDR